MFHEQCFFLYPSNKARNNKGYCQAFDIKTCGLECRIKSYMTYPLCAKHDRPKFVAAIHAKEYLSSMPIYSSLSDEFINDLSTYFTERCLDLKRPIEEGMFYVMHRVGKYINETHKNYSLISLIIINSIRY